jgi:pyroglutamyl-peptidase
MKNSCTRILVSGFQAFGDQSLNPTEKLIETHRNGTLKVPSSVELRSLVLPVAFSEAFEFLEREIRAFDPKIVFCFGLAGGRASFDFERVAINCLDAGIPDNKGEQPRDLLIAEEGREAYFSTLPIRALIQALAEKNVPAKISNTAGTYVCNYLFYRLLESTAQSTRRCGFIHLPFLPEQAVGKYENEPSMPLAQMVQGLEVILAYYGSLKS